MRLLVKTAGDFQLLDMETGKLVRANGLTVIDPTPFTNSRMEDDLQVVAQLSDKATDEEWLEYLAASDNDQELALAAFLSEFAADHDAPKQDGQKKTVSKKDAAKAAAEAEAAAAAAAGKDQA